MGKGMYCVAAQRERAERAAEMLAMLERARDYALGHGIGARKALSTGLFPGILRTKLHTAMQGNNKRLNGDRKETDVLTKAEELALVDWIVASARGKDPATDEEISAKVVAMLKARRADNRRRGHGTGTIKLTRAEDRLAIEAGAEVSNTWLSGFAARHSTVVRKKERNADATRTKKQNEGVVTKHFYGAYGIQASLQVHGHMDMDTHTIKDPRSVWWYDEMPQVLDADNQGPRKKAWGVAGETLERSGSVNRETASVGLCFSLAGFLGGPQFNAARATWSCALADCLKVPSHAKSFDNQIYTLDGKSTFAHMSKTENGIQTQESFLKYLKAFRKEVDAYSAAEVAHGRPPVTFPIWLGSDGQPLVALLGGHPRGVHARRERPRHPPLLRGGQDLPVPAAARPGHEALPRRVREGQEAVSKAAQEEVWRGGADRLRRVPRDLGRLRGSRLRGRVVWLGEHADSHRRLEKVRLAWQPARAGGDRPLLLH
jgi:hypothetical protein